MQKTSAAAAPRLPNPKHGRGYHISMRLKNDWLLYLLLLPVLAWYIVFCYAPMGGLVLAFKKYSFKLGIWGSKWVGFQNFEKMFRDKDLMRALRNTIIFGLGGIAISMPCEIGLALMLNELRMKHTKKLVQTTVTFPHFISWVVLAGIMINLFSSTGVFSYLAQWLGLEYKNPLTTTTGYRWFIWISAVWKEVGWGSIIYLAAITGINPDMYEAAELDGATRLQQMWHVTLPAIRGTICIMLILAIGQLLTNGRFDQIFNTYSSPVYSVADTMDTYIFRESFTTGGMNFGYSTAIGVVKSVFGLIMIVTANKVVTACGEQGLL